MTVPRQDGANRVCDLIKQLPAVDGFRPQFEHWLKTDNSLSYLVAFNSSKAKVSVRANPDDGGDEIGRVVVELAPHLAAGTVIRLSIDPLTATLSNEGGTLSEQHSDGTLQLIDGAIVVP